MLSAPQDAPHRLAPGGRTPLAPQRDTRFMVCLSGEERARLAALARASGHESLASDVRARALSQKAA